MGGEADCILSLKKGGQVGPASLTKQIRVLAAALQLLLLGRCESFQKNAAPNGARTACAAVRMDGGPSTKFAYGSACVFCVKMFIRFVMVFFPMRGCVSRVLVVGRKKNGFMARLDAEKAMKKCETYCIWTGLLLVGFSLGSTRSSGRKKGRME